MLLAEVAGGRRDYRALGHNQLPARLNCHPNVFLTDEIQRQLVRCGLLTTLKGSPYIGWSGILAWDDPFRDASLRLEAARLEEFIDPVG